jgi:hypothetical protein
MDRREGAMLDYEKLGVFYLGKRYDLSTRKVQDGLILYDSKDLTTHAVCVGMTGSGKTGLCVALMEEAAIDGIPVIAIDPKGDLGNLMLTFPTLSPEDFRPWVDEGEALRSGMTPDQFSRKMSELWRSGLSQWHEGPERITRLRESADFAVYTPGSSAGLPINLLRSFVPPPPSLPPDSDGFQDRVASAVEGLLTLLGIPADPLQSREHILLSNLFTHAWTRQTSLDLPELIRSVQKPPFDRLGVFDLESFFDAPSRRQLALRVNNLLASPGFSLWTQGEPLNVEALLYTQEGRPKVSIVSIAHLNDAERMFFVTLLLNEVVSWMRGQPGTTSLRALLYMDEIFGYFPPSANPPSKRPMLTLLKQARAFGLGVVLSTQNPVDLDYKGLANTGTWFIGRLQTERDKMRVLDGLEGASMASGATFERSRMDPILSSLGNRVFLMQNVHDAEPVVFHTRWALSYLRGPLTRAQIETLMAPKKAQHDADLPLRPLTTDPAAHSVKPAPTGTEGSVWSEERPLVPAGIEECFLPLKAPVGHENQLLYRPALLASIRIQFLGSQMKLSHRRDLSLLVPFTDGNGNPSWDNAIALTANLSDSNSVPEENAVYESLPSRGLHPKDHQMWKQVLLNKIHQEETLTLYQCTELKVASRPDEDEGAFRGRLLHMARERRDLDVERLKGKFATRFGTIQDRIRRLEHRVEREKDQYTQQKLQTTISIGSTILGALFGRKATSVGNIGRATTAARGAGRAIRERGDIARAHAELEAEQNKLADLEAALGEAIKGIESAFEPQRLSLDEVVIRPRKSDIMVQSLSLAWTPWRIGPQGLAEPLFK